MYSEPSVLDLQHWSGSFNGWLRSHSLRCLMQVITASGRIQISSSSCVFSSREFLLIPGIFPLWWRGHNLGHVPVAAKQESAAAKCTHDRSTEGTKIPAAQGMEWNGAQKQRVGEMVQWEESGQRLQAGIPLWAKRSSSKWPLLSHGRQQGRCGGEQKNTTSQSSPCWLIGWLTALPSFYSFSNQGNSNFPRTSFKAALDAEHSCTKFPLLTIPCALLYLFPSRRHKPSKHTASWGRRRCCGAVATPQQKQDLQFTADRPCKLCLSQPKTALSRKGRQGENSSWEISTQALNLCPAGENAHLQSTALKEEIAHCSAVL